MIYERKNSGEKKNVSLRTAKKYASIVEVISCCDAKHSMCTTVEMPKPNDIIGVVKSPLHPNPSRWLGLGVLLVNLQWILLIPSNPPSGITLKHCSSSLDFSSSIILSISNGLKKARHSDHFKHYKQGIIVI